MANEIQINATLRYANSPTSASIGTSFFDDQTGNKYMAGVQTIGTSDEPLLKGDVGTIGYLAFRNLDPTNYVELGSTTTVYSIKVPAGKGLVVPWDHTNVYCKANTASCDCDYLIIEV